ncbi:MAG: hypothetical protein KDA16_10790 [Phycisphaerales bacterium]|nr:hypothetical protein [Phycisphaerales bacterium]
MTTRHANASHRRLAPIAIAILTVPCAAASAQDEEPAPAKADSSDISLSLRAGASHTFTADLDDDGGGGDVSVSRASADFIIDWAPAEKFRLSVALRNEVSWYDFGGSAATAFDDIIDDAYEHHLSFRATWLLDGGNSISALGSINTGYEPGADFGDSLTYSAGVAYGFKVNDNLSLTLGVAVRTRLEDNVLVLPIIGVDWRINEKTTLTSEGLGARLSVAIRDDLDVFLRAGAELHEYRLDDDNSALPEGVLSDYRVPVALGLTWSPSQAISLTFEGGAVVWQEYNLLRNDDEVGDVNTDPAAFIGFRLNLMF